jgi:hypothetical protein
MRLWVDSKIHWGKACIAHDKAAGKLKESVL